MVEFDPDMLSYSIDEDPKDSPKKPEEREEFTYNEVKDARWCFDTPGIIKENCVGNSVVLCFEMAGFGTTVLPYLGISQNSRKRLLIPQIFGLSSCQGKASLSFKIGIEGCPDIQAKDCPLVNIGRAFGVLAAPQPLLVWSFNADLRLILMDKLLQTCIA